MRERDYVAESVETLGTWYEVWKLLLDVTVRCTYQLDGRMSASWVSAGLREKWGAERVGLLEPSALMLLRSQASAVPCSQFLTRLPCAFHHTAIVWCARCFDPLCPIGDVLRGVRVFCFDAFCVFGCSQCRV